MAFSMITLLGMGLVALVVILAVILIVSRR